MFPRLPTLGNIVTEANNVSQNSFLPAVYVVASLPQSYYVTQIQTSNQERFCLPCETKFSSKFNAVTIYFCPNVLGFFSQTLGESRTHKLRLCLLALALSRRPRDPPVWLCRLVGELLCCRTSEENQDQQCRLV